MKEKNTNLESFQNSQRKVKKSRYFSLITYLSEKQLSKVMKEHIRSVRAWVYIVHDQDDAEPHIHLLIRTYSTWTCEQITKWFKGYLDKEKKPINTLTEIANDTDALEEYLTHSDEKSKAEGKHEYPREAIHDFGLWEIKGRRDSYDDSYEILNKVIAHYSYRQLVREYGRAFVYHWEKYADLAAEIRQEEGYSKANLISLLELTDHVPKAKIESMDELEKGVGENET